MPTISGCAKKDLNFGSGHTEGKIITKTALVITVSNSMSKSKQRRTTVVCVVF